MLDSESRLFVGGNNEYGQLGMYGKINGAKPYKNIELPNEKIKDA